MKVSVIVSTYNWPQALTRVLTALNAQTYHNLEIIVADDGSNNATRDVVNNFKTASRFDISHVWHPDNGFRLSEIRNKAAAIATGDWLIFIDGDSIPLPSFVAEHVRLAEPGWFLAGNRIMLREEITKQIIANGIDIHLWAKVKFISVYLRGQIKRVHPVFKLPLGALRKRKPTVWQGAKTANLGVWRQDFYAVNGFDESFIGWGFDDSDLVVRLFHNVVYRKEARFAAQVIHLWHPEASRSAKSRRSRP